MNFLVLDIPEARKNILGFVPFYPSADLLPRYLKRIELTMSVRSINVRFLDFY